MSEIKRISEVFPIQPEMPEHEQSEQQSGDEDTLIETQNSEEVVSTSKLNQLAQDSVNKKSELWEKLKKFEANKKKSE